MSENSKQTTQSLSEMIRTGFRRMSREQRQEATIVLKRALRKRAKELGVTLKESAQS